jgi:predicted glycoside hydrolase/deacetylase ChbG (UPF0249 family)
MGGSVVLVVNADDFGLSDGVNEGIARAHEDGIVTSASLMVLRPAAAEAAAYARRRGELGVGLHVELGEWRFERGRWLTVHERVPPASAEMVAEEIRGQLAEFRRLMAADPTHVDSHQHVHLREPARSVVGALGRELGVPVRHLSPIRYCGDFYGQTDEGRPLPHAISSAALLSVLERLGPGMTELCCHPAAREDFESSYRGERIRELETLTDRSVRAAVHAAGLQLSSFAALEIASDPAAARYA